MPSARRYSQKALAFRWPSGFSHGGLLILGLLLSAFGLLMIYSASAVLGLQKFGDSLYYVKKHAIFLGVGWIAYFIAAQIPWVRWVRFRLLFLALSLVLLVLVLIPGLGVVGGGAQRWVNFFGFQFQPSELARLCFVFYVAGTLIARRDRILSFNRGFLPLLIATGLAMFLLIVQPDFGGAMNILLLSVSLWFIGGVPLSYLGGLAILTLPAIGVLVVREGYRLKRVLTFLDPWGDPQGSGFQVIQSFLAFYEGGWTGVGLGNSVQKLFYLPKAHTDFILSVVGEELGMIGVSATVGLFLGLLYFGARIAKEQVSDYGYYLASGAILFLGIPAVLNMMVTVGLMPTKGLPLPFFSSGGSSLIVSLVALGILQSLHDRRFEEPSQDERL